jgi:hypothetical protein
MRIELRSELNPPHPEADKGRKSNRLIVGAHFRMRANYAVDRMEHLTHALF